MSRIKIKEVLRFLVGGGTAVVVDFCIYRLLLLFSWNMDVAKMISFICGAGVGFIINKFWTFERKQFVIKEVLKYVALYTCTGVINAIVNRCTLSIINIQIIGFLVATGVSTVLNFLGQKYVVFER
ncbi:GtrA family protein [Lachnoanaerobaculum saburreum]|jgi:gtrA family protein|uniref:GtrA-like protein n=1 Tax=Lachnoanaerobaculum saburreum TaxID=467210 RepID=A0A134A076_9FIRM|nr:GtrA family protein [Lachnoanaerobaculum saburreum]KXB61079.1 GtrA-like protein [Lachnoanaerobaculum saburreum]